MGVAENLKVVRGRIDEACRAAGRDPGEVRLLPVSKTQGSEVIAEAYAAGVRVFGENRVQEAAEKAAQFADRPDLRWAMIGHLQTNKAKDVAAFAAEFHALDSLKIAAALDRRLQELGRGLDVFIQVNSSGEVQKSGVDPADVGRLAGGLAAFDGLRVRGLMTLAVFSENREAVAACFVRMQELQARMQNLDAAPGSYDELSMGMSRDFELAIAHGATTVRIGQAIFGERPIPINGEV